MPGRFLRSATAGLLLGALFAFPAHAELSPQQVGDLLAAAVDATGQGKLTFADGISAAGRYVEMLAEMDVTVLISNCPQLNNPCNAYNPTPIRVLIWD